MRQTVKMEDTEAEGEKKQPFCVFIIKDNAHGVTNLWILVFFFVERMKKKTNCDLLTHLLGVLIEYKTYVNLTV